MTVIYEFCGLPGSGKSTLLDALQAYLRDRHVRCPDREELERIRERRIRQFRQKHLFFAFLLVRYADVTLAAMRYTYRIAPGSFRNCFRRVLLLLQVLDITRVLENDRSYDLVLMDEGVIQQLWKISVPGKTKGRERLDTLLAKIRNYHKDIRLIYTAIDVEKAVARMQERTDHQGRFDPMDVKDVTTLFQKHLPLLAFLYDYVTSHKDVNSDNRGMTIDAGRNTEENRDKVLDFFDLAQYHVPEGRKG